MVFKEMYNAAKKAIGDRVIKDPEKLSEKVLDRLEDEEGVSEHAKSLAQQIPMMYEMYGRGPYMGNQLKFILREIDDESLEKELKTLFNRFDRFEKVNEVLGR